MNMLSSWQTFHTGFLASGVRAITAGKGKWKPLRPSPSSCQDHINNKLYKSHLRDSDRDKCQHKYFTGFGKSMSSRGWEIPYEVQRPLHQCRAQALGHAQGFLSKVKDNYGISQIPPPRRKHNVLQISLVWSATNSTLGTSSVHLSGNKEPRMGRGEMGRGEQYGLCSRTWRLYKQPCHLSNTRVLGLSYLTETDAL